MRRAGLLTLALLVCSTALGGPAEAVAAALADARRLDPKAARYTRYLWTGGAAPKDRDLWRSLLRLHPNFLSRGADLAAPREVGPDLLAIDQRDYTDDDRKAGDSFRVAYEKLTNDPYFHADVEALREFGHYEGDRWVTTRTARVKKRAAAPWLDPKAVAPLVELTRSQVPVIDGRFFFAQSARQADRKGTGYYDFLGLKSRADFERLTGLDVKAARAFKAETNAVLRRSGVAQENRVVVRYGAIDRGAWRTLDVFETGTGRRNALRNLDDDFEHDAEELYGFLPNGLFGFYLSDAKGVAQESAPDKIGPDTTSTSNDGRIHVMLSCVRCHREGLRPLREWGRRFYRAAGPFRLQAADYEKFKRLRQLYLKAIGPKLARDNADYAQALGEVVALKPAEVAALYRDGWRSFVDDDVELADAARELGTTPGNFQAALRASLRATGAIDPVLGGYIDDPPEGALRDQWEEVYPLAQAVIRGYVPK